MTYSPKNLIIGRLAREFILPWNSKPYLDKLGGNLAYAACGYAIWDSEAALAGVIGADFPESWINSLCELGFETRGIIKRSEPMDQRTFIGYLDDETAENDNPLGHFARRQLTFPRSLLGYSANSNLTDSHSIPSPNSIRAREIPPDYFDAVQALICPMDFITQSILSNAMREGNIHSTLLCTSDGYMTPSFYEDFPSLNRLATILITKESSLRNLFKSRLSDIWEMAEQITKNGCDSVIILRGLHDVLIYEEIHGSRWIMPLYPARPVDPTEMLASFAGGFAYGYQKSKSTLDATTYGAVSASLSIEGSGPFYCLGSLPGLAEARMESIKEAIKKV